MKVSRRLPALKSSAYYLSCDVFAFVPCFLVDILKNHILDLTFCSVAVVDGAKTSAINAMGERMSLERVEVPKGKTEELSEADDMASRKAIKINGKSEVIESDIMATNGVMHVIDTLLPTESSLPLTSMLGARNLTFFKTLLELNGE